MITATNQHQRGTDAACGGQHAFMGGMRRLASVAEYQFRSSRPTARPSLLLGRATLPGLQRAPVFYSHAAHEGHIGALSFRRSVQFNTGHHVCQDFADVPERHSRRLSKIAVFDDQQPIERQRPPCALNQTIECSR